MAHDLRPESLIGHQLLDGEGHNIGKINQVYLDDRTDEPSWVSVNTGFFGRRETLVPLQGAQPNQEDLQVPYAKATVREAPHMESGTHISPETEAQVRDYYAGQSMVPQQRGGRHERDGADVSMGGEAAVADTAGPAESPADEDVVTESGTPGVLSEDEAGREREDGRAQGMGGPGTDTASLAEDTDGAMAADGTTMADASQEPGGGTGLPGSPEADRTAPGQGPGWAAAHSEPGNEETTMTRFEEQVDIGVEQVEVGRSHLHKYLDSEEFDETVTLRREELEVERRPLAEGEESGEPMPAMGEDDALFTLYEERAVVAKRQVPVERVRVRKRMVNHEEHVQGTRFSERIELEDEEGERPSDE